MLNTLLISTSYLPCINTISSCAKHNGPIRIEDNQYFVKHFMHNRAHIISPNGVLNLTIPIVKHNKTKTKIKDIEISNSYNWKNIHLKAIYMNYKNSPFYSFYQEEFIRLYQRNYRYLIDINNDALNLILKLLDISIQLSSTICYKQNYAAGVIDFRNRIDDKQIKPYNQVFEDKVGFINNVSIIDLLFNQGPIATNIILE
ncbi:MAG: WbqC family protein [Solitalea-like symbiont of Tyrophagus putrescentiae]